MVLQRRLDYGFNGYQVPATPRATRSARKRGSFKKRGEDKQMCAFDLLATVAGKLLLENESVPRSSNMSAGEYQCAHVKSVIKKERQYEDPQLELETWDQGSSDGKHCTSKIVPRACDENSSMGSLPSPNNDTDFGFASAVTTSDHSERADALKLENVETETEMGIWPCKAEAEPSVPKGSGGCNILNKENNIPLDQGLHKNCEFLVGEVADAPRTGDPVIWDDKSPAIVSLESRSKMPSFGDHTPPNSFPASQDPVNVGSRDDDENSSGCTHPATTKKPFRPAPRIGDRRIRKILASKYWKAAPKLKDVTFSNSDKDMKPAYWDRSYCYKRLRSERNYPFKKRKFFQFSSASNNRGISGDDISDAPEKGFGKDVGSCPKVHGATGTSSSMADKTASFCSRETHVKLRIKSFRVPELLIELPETATVGSLKRTVMEAVTAVLGGGLHVGVLVQGKKIRDDNCTLLQTGISRDGQLDALGFSLEPNLSRNSSLHHGDSPTMFSCDEAQPLTRYPTTPGVVQQATCDALLDSHMRNLGNFVESDHDSAPSPTNISIDKSTTDCKALVAVPAVSVQALAVVPSHRKSKRSEVVQRRIRRPFSVAEVEALVHAVEKLGTGRWRDVKLRAFDNAKHRTYVDLKDKWKTLVHTARISPQQRRGEPVPQELLDRVLIAHAYWSQQQAKQQLKQPPETCLLL